MSQRVNLLGVVGRHPHAGIGPGQEKVGKGLPTYGSEAA